MAAPLTLHLRRGMKWSDGHPFTADDFIFWYEDMYQNKELVPTPTAIMMINGKPGELEKVDTYTVRFKFPEPYPIFPTCWPVPPRLAGPGLAGLYGMGGYAPAHYLKQFHPKYTSKEELDKKSRDAKFDNWVAAVYAQERLGLNPELPVVTPWKTVTPTNTPTWVLERNPYSIWVDTAGNQLPYIDRSCLPWRRTRRCSTCGPWPASMITSCSDISILGRYRSSWRTSSVAATRSISTRETTAAT